MRCEIGRLSQRDTRPSLGLAVPRTMSQDEGSDGGVRDAGSGETRSGNDMDDHGAAQPVHVLPRRPGQRRAVADRKPGVPASPGP